MLSQPLGHHAHAVHARLSHVRVRVGASREARPREPVEVANRRAAFARVLHDVVEDADGDPSLLGALVRREHGRDEPREQGLERGQNRRLELPKHAPDALRELVEHLVLRRLFLLERLVLLRVEVLVRGAFVALRSALQRRREGVLELLDHARDVLRD